LHCGGMALLLNLDTESLLAVYCPMPMIGIAASVMRDRSLAE
jgi:hypothetical protein